MSRRTRLAIVIACAGPVAAVVACRDRANAEECAKVRDRYLVMVLAEDPHAAKMTPAEREAAREMTLELRKGEKSWKKATERCETEVTRKQADCAVAAPTPDAWEACLR